MIWLASYPRSGNTWLRFMLTALLKGGVKKSLQVEAVVPDIHKREIAAPENSLFAKTHFRWGADHPYRNSTTGAVLLLRHPLDIIVSTWNYGRLIDQPVALETLVERYIVKGRIWSYEFGWAAHARSWLDQDDFETLTVRYEDMLDDTAAQLRRICEFAGFSAEDQAIRSAIETGRLERMQKLEADELAGNIDGLFTLAHELSATPGRYRFVNRGEKRTWTGLIGEEQLKRLTLLRGPELRRLGYTV